MEYGEQDGVEGLQPEPSSVSSTSPVPQSSPTPYDLSSRSKSTSPIRVEFDYSSPAPDSSVPSPSDSLRSQLLQRNKQIAEEEDSDDANVNVNANANSKANSTDATESPVSSAYQLSRGDSALLEGAADGVEEFSVSSSDDEALWEQTLCSRGMAGPKEISPRDPRSAGGGYGSRVQIRGHKAKAVPNHSPWCPKNTF